MNKKFAVKVHNEYLSEAVQKLALANKYVWFGHGARTISDPTDNYGDKAVLFFENKDITYEDISYCRNEDFTLFSAKTDWDKIEQAMKPVEPREIWVNEYKDIGLGARYDTEAQAMASRFNLDGYIRTIKFREVTNE